MQASTFIGTAASTNLPSLVYSTLLQGYDCLCQPTAAVQKGNINPIWALNRLKNKSNHKYNTTQANNNTINNISNNNHSNIHMVVPTQRDQASRTFVVW